MKEIEGTVKRHRLSLSIVNCSENDKVPIEIILIIGFPSNTIPKYIRELKFPLQTDIPIHLNNTSCSFNMKKKKFNLKNIKSQDFFT